MAICTTWVILWGALVLFFVQTSLAGFPDPELYHEALQDRKQYFPQDAKSVCHKAEEKDEEKESESKDFPHKDLYLPKDVLPMEYDLYLHPNLTSFNYKGTVRITMRAVKPAHYIVLHQVGLNIKEKTLKVWKNGELKNVTIKECMENKKHQQFMVMPKRKLEAKHVYVLTLNFEGKITDELEGFYKSSYKTKAGEIKYLAVSDFEPTDARKAFPCFDEPTMKAKFRISITRNKKYTALSNMPIERQETRPDGLITDHFGQSVKMSTYLVAFVVSEFDKREVTTTHGTKIRAWAPKHLVHQTELALEVAKGILPYYENIFEQDYPMSKLDMIAIPDFAAGAMENWGLVTFATSALLCDKQTASPLAKQWVASVVAHEFAHQWFGNLVTLKWWSNLWLNEGFATYIEDFGVNCVRPEWDMMDQFIPRVLHKAMMHDEKSSSHPIINHVDYPDQIDKMFDTIEYKKGAAVNRMLGQILGEQTYFASLKKHLKAYKYGNADTDDLWKSVSHATHNGYIKEIMDTWVNQMGFPVVTLDTSRKERMVATQKKFCLKKCDKIKRSPYHYKWHIPLTYSTQSNPQISNLAWINATKERTEISKAGEKGWIKANLRQMGFYRVNYDVENWKKLGDQLVANLSVFSAADRASLLDDVFNLARAGHVPETVALHLTKYLSKEQSYIPWTTLLKAMSYLDDMLVGSEAHEYFKKYMGHQLEPMSESLQWDDKGSHVERMLKKEIISAASTLGSPSAVEKANKMFKDWKEEQKPIPPTIRQSVLDSAIRWGGEKEFDYLWEQYLNTDDHSLKHVYLFALPSSRNAKLLDKLFERILDKELVTNIDALYVLVYATTHQTGRERVWELMKTKWAELKKRYWKNRYFFSVLMRTSVGEFNTDAKLKEVHEFFRLRECDLTAHHLDVIEDAVASIESNIDWVNKHSKELTDWFKNNEVDNVKATAKVSVEDIEQDIDEEELDDEMEREDEETDEDNADYF